MERLTIEWNRHASISKGVSELRNELAFTDLNFYCFSATHKATLSAHRIVLEKFSKLVRKFAREETCCQCKGNTCRMPREPTTVILPETEPKTVQQLINLIYCGKADLADLGEKLQLQKLLKRLEMKLPEDIFKPSSTPLKRKLSHEEGEEQKEKKHINLPENAYKDEQSVEGMKVLTEEFSFEKILVKKEKLDYKERDEEGAIKPGEDKNTCIYCKESFDDILAHYCQLHFSNHLKRQYCLKNEDKVCKMCKKFCENDEGLMMHMGVGHKKCLNYVKYCQKDDKQLTCHICQTAFATPNGLLGHFAVTHYVTKILQLFPSSMDGNTLFTPETSLCPICRQTNFPNKSSYVLHMARLHDVMDKVAPSIANKIRRLKSLDTTQQQQTVINVVPNKTLVLNESDVLDKAEMAAAKDNLRCPICEQSFEDKLSLKVDLTNHYIPSLRNKYGKDLVQCPLCKYRNDNSQTLCHLSVAHNYLEEVVPDEIKKFLKGSGLFNPAPAPPTLTRAPLPPHQTATYLVHPNVNPFHKAVSGFGAPQPTQSRPTPPPPPLKAAGTKPFGARTSPTPPPMTSHYPPRPHQSRPHQPHVMQTQYPVHGQPASHSPPPQFGLFSMRSGSLTKKRLRPLVECPICKVPFRKGNNFDRHMALQHLKAELIVHLNVHEKKCKLCGAVLADARTSLTHVGRMHGFIDRACPKGGPRVLSGAKQHHLAGSGTEGNNSDLPPLPPLVRSPDKSLPGGSGSQHKRMIPSLERSVPCPLCTKCISGTWTKWKKHIYAHVRGRMQNDYASVGNKCPYCPKMFNNTTDTIFHLAMAHNRLFQYLPADKRASLKRDGLTLDPNRRKFACPMCSHERHVMGCMNFSMHIFQHCTVKMRYQYSRFGNKCNYCNYVGIDENTILKHVAFIHQKLKDFMPEEAVQVLVDLGFFTNPFFQPSTSEPSVGGALGGQRQAQDPVTADFNGGDKDDGGFFKGHLLEPLMNADEEAVPLPPVQPPIPKLKIRLGQDGVRAQQNSPQQQHEQQPDLDQVPSGKRKCPVCLRTDFRNRGSILRHMIGAHYSEAFRALYAKCGRVCPECDLTLSSDQECLRHIAVVHEKIRRVIPPEIEDFLMRNGILTGGGCGNIEDLEEITIDGEPVIEDASQVVSAVMDVDFSEENNSGSSLSCDKSSRVTHLKCPECKQEFYKGKLLIHLTHHFKNELNAAYPDKDSRHCDICYSSFISFDGLVSHMGAVHGKVLHFLKEKDRKELEEVHGFHSQLSTPSKRQQSRRISALNNSNEIKDETDYADFNVDGNADYVVHQTSGNPRTPQPATPMGHECPQCQRTISSKFELGVHLISHYRDMLRPYVEGLNNKCPECGLKVAKNNRFLAHYFLSHKFYEQVQELPDQVKEFCANHVNSTGTRTMVQQDGIMVKGQRLQTQLESDILIDEDRSLEQTIDEFAQEYLNQSKDSEESDEEEDEGDEMRMFSCPRCPGEFTLVSKWRDHLVQHFQTQMTQKYPKLIDHQCHLCRIPLNNHFSYLKHLAFSHYKIIEYMTEESDGDTIKNILTTATSYSWDGNKTLKCPLCSFHTLGVSEIGLHLSCHFYKKIENAYAAKSRSSNDCSMCDDTNFEDRVSLIAHLGVDEGKILSFADEKSAEFFWTQLRVSNINNYQSRAFVDLTGRFQIAKENESGKTITHICM